MPYTASLIFQENSSNLSVSNVGTVEGTAPYSENNTTLYVGLDGDSDWPSCSGAIDSIKVEPLNQ